MDNEIQLKRGTLKMFLEWQNQTIHGHNTVGIFALILKLGMVVCSACAWGVQSEITWREGIKLPTEASVPSGNFNSSLARGGSEDSSRVWDSVTRWSDLSFHIIFLSVFYFFGFVDGCLAFFSSDQLIFYLSLGWVLVLVCFFFLFLI